MELGGRRLSMTKWAKKTEKERKKEREEMEGDESWEKKDQRR